MGVALNECITIPGLLCSEPQPEVQFPASVVDNLRVTNAELRVALGTAEDTASHLRGLLHEQQRLSSALQARVNNLQKRVAVLRGEIFDNPDPDSICVYVPITDTLELVVDAEYSAEIPATRDEPGEDAACETGCVLIHGEWVYIPDLIQRLTDKREIRRLVEKRIDEQRMQGGGAVSEVFNIRYWLFLIFGGEA